ncbi:MAG: trypsin-like peptidase domain-containing protein [Gammaproteobacteria bacterium]|jgi:S1-C subfamily serine protease|nr:trypsin-like peptidase domain-containing protein [Gammaproteobacteria bacterium]
MNKGLLNMLPARLLLGLFLFSMGMLCRAEESTWAGTLDMVSSGVVSIQIDGVRAFDTEWSLSSQATGFVVDWERGLVLTNRHVVMPGPVTARAVFLNNEEVDLLPVYRDPVHDFGFYRFDPSALRFIRPHEFSLRPDKVHVGREIRVIGNDAGEQLSILAGTIAKLNRRAPMYGRGKYNDFNTFYLQAASSTSGGSSGSPVVDIDGDVLALNAGASNAAASSFFLPLDRVRRALDLVRKGLPVTRGTLQTMFQQLPYDELRRLGLQAVTEELARREHPEQMGLLVVEQVTPGGPAQEFLQPGDILLRVNGELISSFVALEAVLDESVDRSVTLELQRGGLTRIHRITVQDLHSITPDRYLEISDAVVHNLSYQQARHLNMPVTGVYVANPGYMFGGAGIPRGAVINGLDGEVVDNLDTFLRLFEEHLDGSRIMLRFFTFDDPQTGNLRSVTIDRSWYPVRVCRRDDAQGIWPCQELAPGPRASAPEPASTRFTANGDSRLRKIAPSLVLVNFDMPYSVSGISQRHYHGTGLLVDAQRGLVVVDRNTVPEALGDVRLTFASSVEVPGRVTYVHPLHNLALVSYDPSLIGDTPVRQAVFAERQLADGDPVWVAGLKGNSKPFIQKTEVATVDALTLPLSRTMGFRESNLDAIALVNPPGEVDGVLMDNKSRVLAMWTSLSIQGNEGERQINLGLSADIVREMVEVVSEGRDLRSLEAEFMSLSLASARKLGLPTEWILALEKHNPERRNVLQVLRLVGGSDAADQLRSGDLLLALDGKVVNSFREVETAVQGRPAAIVSVWRNGAVRELEVETAVLSGDGIDRVVSWAGALLQAPHRALSAQRGNEPVGVYVSFFNFGAPASRYGLVAGRRILEVDGVATPNLDVFLAQVSGKHDRESVRIKTINWNDQIDVLTLKLDKHYWPAYELRKIDGVWRREELD